LLDLWAQKHLGQPLDRDGAWAASGKVIDELLPPMLADPYFAEPPPKSTGRDQFNEGWLSQFRPERFAPQDVQATFVALTTQSIADAVTRFCSGAREVFVSGGGASNSQLIGELARRLPGVRVATTAAAGVDPDWVEAMAFAWLARETLAGRTSSLAEVTGAAGPRVLGAIYPA
jgi:anhydro-N-acetylmuramic acid kinase